MAVLKRSIAFLAVSAGVLSAQSSTDTAEALKLVAKMGASYYHPDGLQGLVCDVKVDFYRVFRQINLPISPEAVRAAASATIQVHSKRGQTAWVVFSWSDRDNPRRDSLETAVTHLIRSIFGIYWTFIANPLKPGSSDPIHVEPTVGGGHVFVDDGTVKWRVEADQDNVPVKFQFEASLTTVTIIPYYSMPPKPAPGDLRRMTAVDQSQMTGKNMTNARLDLDYQDVAGFHVPHHASFSVGGVFTVPVEFSGCTIATTGR